MRFLNTVGTVLATSTVASKMPLYLYVDDWTYTGQALADEYVKMAKAGASAIIMGFHLIGNPNFPNNMADSVLAWSNLSQTVREATMKEIHDAGCKLLVSVGGESEGAAWLNADPTDYGKTTCTALKALNVDGVDFDKEGVAWDNKQVNDWTDAAVKACRSVWPEVFLTSAPQAPYFNSQASQGLSYADGLKNGAGFDRYLIQFYNQWPAYDKYEQLFTNTELTQGPSISSIYKEFPMATKEQFVVGKVRQTGDGSNVVPLDTLKEWVCKAEKEIGYKGGLMLWKHHLGTDVSYITDLAKPCDGETDPTNAPNTTEAPTEGPTTAAPTEAPTEGPTTADPTSAAPTRAPTTRAPTTAASTTEEPTEAPETTRHNIPTTARPTGAPNTTTGAKPSPGIVGDCEKMIAGGPGFDVYDSVCRGYCKEYVVGGPRAPWCVGKTGQELASCVTKERTYCVIH